MDRRDRFTVLACDSECRSSAICGRRRRRRAPRSRPGSPAQQPAGASDLVGAVRAATDGFGSDRRPRSVGDLRRRRLRVDRLPPGRRCRARDPLAQTARRDDHRHRHRRRRGGAPGRGARRWRQLPRVDARRAVATAAAQALESTYGNALAMRSSSCRPAWPTSRRPCCRRSAPARRS